MALYHHLKSDNKLYNFEQYAALGERLKREPFFSITYHIKYTMPHLNAIILRSISLLLFMAA